MDWFFYGYLLQLGVVALISVFFLTVATIVLWLVYTDLKKYGVKETLKDLIGGGRDVE